MSSEWNHGTTQAERAETNGPPPLGVGDKVFSLDVGFCFVVEDRPEDSEVVVQEVMRPHDTNLAEAVVPRETVSECTEAEFPTYNKAPGLDVVSDVKIEEFVETEDGQ